MTILDAVRDRALFGRWFKGDSWRAWFVFLTAVFGLPLRGKLAIETFRQHTGRQTPPSTPAREAWVIVGRRGGKSRISALVGVYLACFRDYGAVLAPGEVGTVAVIAADRRQARTIMRYIVGFIDSVPMLAQMKAARSKESIELTNGVVIEVHTANFRAVRGYTLVAVIADEIAFWHSEDSAANPDHEIIAGLRPGLATVPGALLLAISSPYAHRGALYDAHRKHYGQDDDPVLVWQADSHSMNPTLSDAVIAEAYAEDPAAARSEYGAEFRSDLESYIGTDELRACVVPSRASLPPTAGAIASCFVDAAGGAGKDSFTWAIGWPDRDGRAVVAKVGEIQPPFNPDEAVKTIAADLHAYEVNTVEGDRYAGDWPAERFRAYGITYRPAEKNRSELYLEALPILTGLRCELPDYPRLLSQFSQLQRRTGGTGRDAIDHQRGQHDDLSNVVAGLLVQLTSGRQVIPVAPGGDERRSAWAPFAPEPNSSGHWGRWS